MNTAEIMVTLLCSGWAWEYVDSAPEPVLVNRLTPKPRKRHFLPPKEMPKAEDNSLYCSRGHKKEGDNLYVWGFGQHRECRACRLAYGAFYRAKKKAETIQGAS